MNYSLCKGGEIDSSCNLDARLGKGGIKWNNQSVTDEGKKIVNQDRQRGHFTIDRGSAGRNVNNVVTR